MYSICCTPPPQDYGDLFPDQKQRFGYLVNLYRKKGMGLEEAQEKAYFEVTKDDIPFDA
jgi:hypothetical protein